LTLDDQGCVCVGVVDLARVPPISTVVPVNWSQPADTVSLRFKTTDRLHYDAALARAWAAGADEAILVDDGGRVVEATRANVWVRRRGELLTPPLGERGLEGVMRGHLLATRPDAREADLTVDDLRQADEVLLSNAVRGLFSVSLGTRAPGSA
jgi:para-aminobenzoate synthetase/4-amino-4-deoxychorismate lyase